MDFDGKRVAVTGAAGFIGNAVCKRLTGEGADVAGLDLPGAGEQRVASASAQFRPCDVTDAGAVGEALADRELVVHTAAIVSDWGAMSDFVAVNVGGTRNVMDAAQRAGIARVVHLSSVAIWGYGFRRDLDEDAPPRPCGVPYIDTKGTSEAVAREGGATIVRPGDVYGPGSIPWAVRPLEALRAHRFAVPRRGLMTPVYIDDLVDCIVRALTVEGGKGEAFVAWDGHAVPTPEFFDHYARMLGRSRVPALPRPLLSAVAGADELASRLTGRTPTATRWAVRYLSRTNSYSNKRAREVLGWEPQVTLAEGMRRTRNWFAEQGLLP